MGRFDDPPERWPLPCEGGPRQSTSAWNSPVSSRHQGRFFVSTGSGLIWLADARAAGVAALSGGRSRPRSGRRPTRHRVCHPQQPHRPRLRPRPARPQGVCRRARSNEVRARGPDRPDLRPAARRPVYPAGIRVKRSWAGMRRHALGVCERSGWIRRGAGRRMCSSPVCSTVKRRRGSHPAALAWTMVRGRQEAACAAVFVHIWAASATEHSNRARNVSVPMLIAPDFMSCHAKMADPADPAPLLIASSNMFLE